MKIYVLASGSKGNAMYLEINKKMIMIDAGISYLKIKDKSEKLGIDLKQVDTLFLTHEHQDHVLGLQTLLKKGNIKTIYSSKGTINSLSESLKSEILKKEVKIIKADEILYYNEAKITPILLSHDAKEPLGFVFEKDNKKIVHLTDTGYVDHSYHKLLENANIYFLEANHDPEMLLKSKRPYLLKKRILSEKGHLSNDDSAWLINRIIKQKTIWIVAHISEDCNTEIKVEEAIIKQVEDPTLLDLYYTDQESLLVFEV